MSGLIPSIPKSKAYFCNVVEHVKQAMLLVMPFEEGSLPVRYLGVPLITTRLLHKDCNMLVERLENRITDWRNKSLSFAGRVQLVNSVLSSFHIYWAFVFILPVSIIKDLEKQMRSFFMVSRADGERLKNRSFWDVKRPKNCSWGWRKLLQLRDVVRPFLWKKIGDGRNTSLWFDKWAEVCPLSSLISPRQIAQAGLSLNSNVADVVQNGEWKWPTAWLDLFPVLINLLSINLHANQIDTMVWKELDGKENVLTRVVWNSIRMKGNEVNWAKVIWNSHSIPRHAFLVWMRIKIMAKVPDMTDSWTGILQWLIVKSNSRSSKNVIGRLLVAATAYFIWQERNNRLFSNHARPLDQLFDLITNTSSILVQLIVCWKNGRYHAY
uniref:uncharacterized protein LOC122597001 n=1 Tax=Erigeron canadensis TaxID=72917 RepID=UPI001CB92EC7|nr:uncharacterized protein LOC122597001 [Erigeron canadensis]